MAEEAEREDLVRLDQGWKVAFVAGIGELAEGVITSLDVRGVVLAAMQLEDLPRMAGLRAVVVGRVGKRVDGHERLFG